MLVSLNDIMPRARRGRYAVGAFNTSNLEMTQAMISAAEELGAPVVVAVSEKAIKYAGLADISRIITGLGARASVPVVMHLDHGANFEIAKSCIDNGFTSVMIDGSHLPYPENLKVTRKVVQYAYRRKVSVEAEIGRLAGIEDDTKVKKGEAIYTDPDEAEKFARESGCDALAVAIGTSHGAYKFKGEPRLRIDILKQIAARVEIPLVLHGASGVKKKWVDRANKFGARLMRTRGVPDNLLKEAIKHGIAKINVDTDLRIAFTAGVREFLKKNPADFDPRKIIGAGRDKIKEVVKAHIILFNSSRFEY
jgi:fructose-bisphosphate aldolase class II